MTHEQLRLQMLSGIITESEYKAKLEESTSNCGCDIKESLNENFVGLGMVGNIFDREKTDYELAFEHFSKESLSENEEVEENEIDEQDGNIGLKIHYALSSFRGMDERSTKEYLEARTLADWDKKWEAVRELLTKYYGDAIDQ